MLHEAGKAGGGRVHDQGDVRIREGGGGAFGEIGGIGIHHGELEDFFIGGSGIFFSFRLLIFSFNFPSSIFFSAASSTAAATPKSFPPHL